MGCASGAAVGSWPQLHVEQPPGVCHIRMHTCPCPQCPCCWQGSIPGRAPSGWQGQQTCGRHPAQAGSQCCPQTQLLCTACCPEKPGLSWTRSFRGPAIPPPLSLPELPGSLCLGITGYSSTEYWAPPKTERHLLAAQALLHVHRGQPASSTGEARGSVSISPDKALCAPGLSHPGQGP